jgi:hypothetical protein
MRYILVEWPESQEFIGQGGCYYCNPGEDDQLDQAMFVPEKEYYKKIGLPYKFSNTATNGELIDLLSQFPRDAIVGINIAVLKNYNIFQIEIL